jgi:hypothetical protein
MAVDQPPSPQCENAEASSSWGTSSLGKYFYYKGYDTPDINPDYDQEGAGRSIHSHCFNDRSDKSLTNNEMPDMRQVLKGDPLLLSAQLPRWLARRLWPQVSRL